MTVLAAIAFRTLDVGLARTLALVGAVALIGRLAAAAAVRLVRTVRHPALARLRAGHVALARETVGERIEAGFTLLALETAKTGLAEALTADDVTRFVARALHVARARLTAEIVLEAVAVAGAALALLSFGEWRADALAAKILECN